MPRRKYPLQSKDPHCNSRPMSQRLRHKRELEDEMNLFYNEWLVAENIGCCSEDVTSTDSIRTRKKDSTPVSNTDFLDSMDENHKLNLPIYPLRDPAVYPCRAIKLEILNSSKTNQKPLMTSNKKKYTRTKHVYKSSKMKTFHSECLKSRKFNNSITLKYELPKCSVLLHDCLSPQNMASTLASFKSLKINKCISETEFESTPNWNSSYFFHVSEGDEKMAFSNTYKKNSCLETYKKMPYSKKDQKSKMDCNIYLNKKKARSNKSKIICNCSETSINKNQSHENNFESSQQLCSCLKGVNKLPEDLTPIEILMKETLFFYPDFGKITCGINKIN